MQLTPQPCVPRVSLEKERRHCPCPQGPSLIPRSPAPTRPPYGQEPRRCPFPERLTLPEILPANARYRLRTEWNPWEIYICGGM